MRWIAIFIFFSFCLPSSTAQSFEGRISYNCHYKSKIPGTSDEQLTTMIGDRQLYFFGHGTFKVESNGEMLKSQLFIRGDNRVYTRLSVSDSFYYSEASENADPATGVEVNKGVITILGYKCDELVFTTKNGRQRFYYSSALKLDPAPFANFNAGNWSAYVEVAQAVPLKMILQSDRFDAEITATEIREQRMDSSFFSLPPGAKTEKSPF